MNLRYEQLEPFGIAVYSTDANIELSAIPAGEIDRLIDRHRVAVLRGFGRLEGEALPKYCEALGEIQEWDFGAVNELRVSGDAQNYLYTNREVPFHWDGAFAGRVPRLIFFHCDEAPQPGTGGETLFTDTSRLLEFADTETQDKWRGIEITYTTEKIVHYGGSFTSPMITGSGGCEVIRYAEPVADLNPVYLKIRGLDADEQEAFVEDMRHRLREDGCCYRHTWMDGDVVIADNRVLLHGRSAFAEDSRRLIRRVNIL